MSRLFLFCSSDFGKFANIHCAIQLDDIHCAIQLDDIHCVIQLDDIHCVKLAAKGGYMRLRVSSSANIFEKRGDPWMTTRDAMKDFRRNPESEDPDLDRYFLADKATRPFHQSRSGLHSDLVPKNRPAKAGASIIKPANAVSYKPADVNRKRAVDICLQMHKQMRKTVCR